MKKIKLLSILLAAGLVFTGCANDTDDDVDDVNDDKEVVEDVTDEPDDDLEDEVEDEVEEELDDEDDSGDDDVYYDYENKIDGGKAKKIAIKDAGFTFEDVQIRKVDLDKDNGKLIYEIEFIQGNDRYEYEIDANTEEIISKEKNDKASSVAGKDKAESGKVELSTDEAVDVALKDASLSKDEVIFHELPLDHGDGIFKYEIKFSANNTEYEYKIHAETGEVLEQESEKDDDKLPGDLIGMKAAYDKALETAGIKKDDVVLFEIELDEDDNQFVYEVQIDTADQEFECVINAQSGDVLETDN